MLRIPRPRSLPNLHQNRASPGDTRKRRPAPGARGRSWATSVHLLALDGSSAVARVLHAGYASLRKGQPGASFPPCPQKETVIWNGKGNLYRRANSFLRGPLSFSPTPHSRMVGNRAPRPASSLNLSFHGANLTLAFLPHWMSCV